MPVQMPAFPSGVAMRTGCGVVLGFTDDHAECHRCAIVRSAVLLPFRLDKNEYKLHRARRMPTLHRTMRRAGRRHCLQPISNQRTTSTVMRIKSEKDFYSGLLFMAVGVGFAWGATSYKIGDASRMGPGYFPLLLGVLLALVGALVMFLSLVVETEDGDPVGRIAWRPLIFIILANLVFGVLLGGLPSIELPYMGLMAAIFAMTFIAAYAGDEFRFKEVLILAIVLAALSYIAFIWLLSLQFPAWPAFISG